MQYFCILFHNIEWEYKIISHSCLLLKVTLFSVFSSPLFLCSVFLSFQLPVSVSCQPWLWGMYWIYSTPYHTSRNILCYDYECQCEEMQEFDQVSILESSELRSICFSFRKDIPSVKLQSPDSKVKVIILILNSKISWH